jgi:hypothetical protein
MTQEARAWREAAGLLADLFLERFFNRLDCSGAYTPLAQRGKPKTGDPTHNVPASYTSKHPVDAARLARHLRGLRPEDVIGAHTTSTENTCKWGAFDVDRHDDETDPRKTLATAQALRRDAIQRGFRPLLLHSNGKGGYHLFLFFAAPVPCRDLFRLLAQMAKAADFAGEHFPKQPAVKVGGYGNWLRCPGRHHTREFWCEAFDGEAWLAGAACVNCVRACLTCPDDPALVPATKADLPTPIHVRPSVARRPCASLHERIARYAARLPSLEAGQGRNRTAFAFAAFLGRDVNLSDADALAWLAGWDSGNRPPLGEGRLAEVLRCAHAYGAHAYGSGLRAKS